MEIARDRDRGGAAKKKAWLKRHTCFKRTATACCVLLLGLLLLSLSYARLARPKGGASQDTNIAKKYVSSLYQQEDLPAPGGLKPPGDRSAWTSKVSSISAENFDEEKGACVEGASGPCTVVLRFPPQPVWHSDLSESGTKGVLNLEHPVTGAHDAGFVCALANLDLTEDHWITKVEPLIDQFEVDGETVDLVHHLNTFFCDKAILETTEVDIDDVLVCSEDRFMQSRAPQNLNKVLKDAFEMSAGPSLGPACKQFGLVYDRGAQAFTLPEDVGLKVGPSTAMAQALALQIHYLVPENLTQPLWDHSGFRITLEKVEEAAEPKRTPAALVAFNDFGLYYPKDTYTHHQYPISGEELTHTLKGDFSRFGSIQPIAAHLHAHFLTKAIWVDHLRDGVKVGEYGRKDPFNGHSADQSFFLLPDEDTRRPLLPDDSLEINCIVNTTGAPYDITYGVAHNTEMCAVIMLYREHDPMAADNFEHANMVFYYSNEKRLMQSLISG